MSATRAAKIARSAPVALTATALLALPPLLPPHDCRPRRPRSHSYPCSLSLASASPSRSHSTLRAALLPALPNPTAPRKPSCMVCRTATAAAPSEPQNECPNQTRSSAQSPAATFVGAVSAAVAASALEANPPHTVFMDVDSPAASQQQSHQSPDSTALSTSTVTTAESAPPDIPRDISDDSSPSFAFRSGVVCIPHPEKVGKGGEDAFFIQKNALGVFDGVGGWASIGVDAGLYSKELARLTASYVDREGSATIVDALKNAKDNNRAVGSSTACVIGLNGDKLVGVNLGDSGLVVIRDGAIVYRTSEQQHYFNCPYQIGTDSLDTVEVGGPIDFALRHGDWIVMGTDGLWDNVFPAKIVDIVMAHRRPEGKEDDSVKPATDTSSDGGSVVSDCSGNDSCAEDAQLIAKQLADAAVKVANDERSSSPFAVNAQNAGHLFLGGKVDDITIIAALVTDPNRDSASSKHVQQQQLSESNRNTSD